MAVDRGAIVDLNRPGPDVAVQDCCVAHRNAFLDVNFALYRTVHHQVFRHDIPENHCVLADCRSLHTLNLSHDEGILRIQIICPDISCDISGYIHPAVRIDIAIHHTVHFKFALNRNIAVDDSSLWNDSCFHVSCCSKIIHYSKPPEIHFMLSILY